MMCWATLLAQTLRRQWGIEQLLQAMPGGKPWDTGRCAAGGSVLAGRSVVGRERYGREEHDQRTPSIGREV